MQIRSIRSRLLITEPSLFFLAAGLFLPLESDLVRFGSVVHEGLFEPGVLQCFLGCYPFLRVVDEYPPEEVEELTVEVGVGWYCFL